MRHTQHINQTQCIFGVKQLILSFRWTKYACCFLLVQR